MSEKKKRPLYISQPVGPQAGPGQPKHVVVQNFKDGSRTCPGAYQASGTILTTLRITTNMAAMSVVDDWLNGKGRTTACEVIYEGQADQGWHRRWKVAWALKEEQEQHYD